MKNLAGLICRFVWQNHNIPCQMIQRKLGRPRGFLLKVREFKPSIGAGFIVALTGDVMTMPGLPKKPAALNMDVDENGNAVGLF